MAARAIWIESVRALTVRLGLRETGALLWLASLSLFAFGFVKIAGEMREGDTAALDRAILLALRNPQDLSDPIGPTWLEEAARDMTALGGHAVLGLITLSVLTYLWLSDRRHAALFVIAAVVGGMLLSAGLKVGFERPRPDLVPHGTRVYTASFPSGHAMLSAVTYLTLGTLLARVQTRRGVKTFLVGLAIVTTLLVGASRVYLGVHWPSDVLAGWCSGAAWASLCWLVALALQRRGEVETGAHNPVEDAQQKGFVEAGPPSGQEPA